MRFAKEIFFGVQQPFFYSAEWDSDFGLPNKVVHEYAINDINYSVGIKIIISIGFRILDWRRNGIPIEVYYRTPHIINCRIQNMHLAELKKNYGNEYYS